MSQIVRMKVPKDCGGMTLGGYPCDIDKNGEMDVPAIFVEDAKSHGCTIVVKKEKPAAGE